MLLSMDTYKIAKFFMSRAFLIYIYINCRMEYLRFFQVKGLEYRGKKIKDTVRYSFCLSLFIMHFRDIILIKLISYVYTASKINVTVWIKIYFPNIYYLRVIYSMDLMNLSLFLSTIFFIMRCLRVTMRLR